MAHGTLHDEDKGLVDLTGLELGFGATDEDPSTVCNPGGLSELQQAGIVEAVVSHIRVLGLRFSAATLVADGRAPVVGVLVTWPGDQEALAVFGTPRADWDAAGGHARLPFPAAPGMLASLTTLPDSVTHGFEMDAAQVGDVVCVRGRLVHVNPR